MGVSLSHCLSLDCSQDTDHNETEPKGRGEGSKSVLFRVSELSPTKDIITTDSEQIELIRALIEEESFQEQKHSPDDSQQSVLSTISPTKERSMGKRYTTNAIN